MILWQLHRRKIAPNPNFNANLNPNANPNQGPIFLRGNCPDAEENKYLLQQDKSPFTPSHIKAKRKKQFGNSEMILFSGTK